MKVVVTGRNINLTPALRKYAEGKVGKFEKYLTKSAEATVTLGVQKHLQKAEIHIHAGGTILQAVGVTEELYASIDEAIDKLDIQVRKFKDKITSKRKVSGRTREAEPMPEEPSSGVIIKRQRYEMKPMPPEEAAELLETEGRGFVVFTNSESGILSVIYRLKNGNFGLIEPGAK